jgi:hypothetical protein
MSLYTLAHEFAHAGLDNNQITFLSVILYYESIGDELNAKLTEFKSERNAHARGMLLTKKLFSRLGLPLSRLNAIRLYKDILLMGYQLSYEKKFDQQDMIATRRDPQQKIIKTYQAMMDILDKSVS